MLDAEMLTDICALIIDFSTFALAASMHRCNVRQTRPGVQCLIQSAGTASLRCTGRCSGVTANAPRRGGHYGRIAVDHRDARRCSVGLEIASNNCKKVRVAFARP